MNFVSFLHKIMPLSWSDNGAVDRNARSTSAETARVAAVIVRNKLRAHRHDSSSFSEDQDQASPDVWPFEWQERHYPLPTEAVVEAIPGQLGPN
jgi:hypothetical protein